MTSFFRIFDYFLDGPINRGSEGLTEHRATGFADGRQSPESPFLRTASLELAHEQTIREHDEIHVPGLAFAVTQLTVPHPQFLLAVPMKCLRACPPMSVHLQNAMNLPLDTIRSENLARLLVPTVIPQDQDPHLVVHTRNAHRTGEVPLPSVTTPDFLATGRTEDRKS